MVNFLEHLDRRWIFLCMAVAVAVPILLQQTFPEAPTPLAQAAFDQIDQLPAGSKILLALDYDQRAKANLRRCQRRSCTSVPKKVTRCTS